MENEIDVSDINRTLGRIEGALAEIKTTQAKLSAQYDALDARLRPVEVNAGKAGMLGGVLSGVGVALIADIAKRWIH